MPFTIGASYNLNFFGNVVPAIVMSFDGSFLRMMVNGELTMYFWDSTRRTVTDKNRNELLIRPSIASFENLMSCPSITTEELEHEVWVRIRGDEPSCMCLRCILNHVIELHSVARNPSVEDNMSNTLMCIYIMDSMIPTFIARIVNSFADGARNIVAQVLQQSLSDGSLESIIQALIDHMNDEPNDVIAQVLQESMADGPKRHGAKSEVMSSLASRIHPYDASIHKCDTCTICMETFEDIAKEMGKSAMVINCPNCNNCFCAGKAKCDTDAKEDEDCCQGFLRLMDDDNRCPICRMEVKDWTGTVLPDISKFKVKETPPINMVVPNYNCDGIVTVQYDSFDVSGSMSGEPMLVSIGMEIPVPEISSRHNNRHKRRGEIKKYPPMKLKTPYSNAYQKKRTVMRHKRQHYGR